MNEDRSLVEDLKKIYLATQEPAWKDSWFLSTPGGDEILYTTLVKQLGSSIEKREPNGPATFSMDIIVSKLSILRLSDFGNLALLRYEENIPELTRKIIRKFLTEHNWTLVPEETVVKHIDANGRETWVDILFFYS